MWGDWEEVQVEDLVEDLALRDQPMRSSRTWEMCRQRWLRCVSLMALAFPGFESSNEHVDFESTALKANYGTVDEALIVAEFKQALPSFFWKRLV